MQILSIEEKILDRAINPFDVNNKITFPIDNLRMSAINFISRYSNHYYNDEKYDPENNIDKILSIAFSYNNFLLNNNALDVNKDFNYYVSDSITDSCNISFNVSNVNYFNTFINAYPNQDFGVKNIINFSLDNFFQNFVDEYNDNKDEQNREIKKLVRKSAMEKNDSAILEVLNRSNENDLKFKGLEGGIYNFSVGLIKKE